MTRLCDLTAAEVTCCIGGREYRLTPLRVAELGEIERAIDDGATDELPPSLATLDQLEQFLATSAGQELTFWHCLRRHQPNLPREAANELLHQAREESGNFDRLWQSLNGFPSHHSTLGTPHSAFSNTPHSAFSNTFLHLSLTHHWTPRQISDLTLPQLLAYLCDEPGERRTVWMSPAEVRARHASGGGGRATPAARSDSEQSFRESDTRAEGIDAQQTPAISDPFDQSGYTLDQIARTMADMRQSLSRLERRNEVARYGLPEAG